MLSRTLLTALLATSTALATPIPQIQEDNCQPTAPKAQEFSVAFSLGLGAANQTTYLSANVVQNGTTATYLLVGRLMSAAYPGSPAYLNGTSPTASLVFDLGAQGGEGLFGAEAPDLGLSYGVQSPVFAALGYQEKAWGVSSEGGVYHKMSAAFNGFFGLFATRSVLTFSPLGIMADMGLYFYSLPGHRQWRE